jgi:hypothetical protein
MAYSNLRRPVVASGNQPDVSPSTGDIAPFPAIDCDIRTERCFDKNSETQCRAHHKAPATEALRPARPCPHQITPHHLVHMHTHTTLASLRRATGHLHLRRFQFTGD